MLCSVSGPYEGDNRRKGAGVGRGGGGGEAQIQVDMNIAGFSGTDRRRAVTGGVGSGGGKGGGDKSVYEFNLLTRRKMHKFIKSRHGNQVRLTKMSPQGN